MKTTLLGARTVFVALAITLAATLSAAQGTVNLTNRKLQFTTFQAGTGNPVEAACSTAGCLTTAAVFTRPIECPVSSGQTCTFYLHLEGQALVNSNDTGLFRFLIDGVAPVPSQTNTDGTVSFDSNDPTSGGSFSARSYAVIAKVKNTTKNQLHMIEVDIGCQDLTDGGGCFAELGFRTLSTSVYTP
jgi:hypothetical protein